MKVKTNLSPSELEHVGEKLVDLAKGQQETSYNAENSAEKELIRKFDHTFTVMLESLRDEFSRVLSED